MCIRDRGSIFCITLFQKVKTSIHFQKLYLLYFITASIGLYFFFLLKPFFLVNNNRSSSLNTIRLYVASTKIMKPTHNYYMETAYQSGQGSGFTYEQFRIRDQDECI